MIRQKIQELLKAVVSEIGLLIDDPNLEHPSDSSHGDYSTNIAMRANQLLQTNPHFGSYDEPITIAQKLVEILNTNKPAYIEKIEAVKPGFINFWLSQDYLLKNLERVDEQFGNGEDEKQKIMLEFADPNPFKEFHIGHLRNITLGESFS